MTTITQTPRPKMSEQTYNTREVIEMTGLSFRVLDWWLRHGVVVLDDQNMPGSGTPRVYTEREVAAIRRLADRYHAAQAEIELIRSGQAWTDEAFGT